MRQQRPHSYKIELRNERLALVNIDNGHNYVVVHMDGKYPPAYAMSGFGRGYCGILYWLPSGECCGATRRLPAYDLSEDIVKALLKKEDVCSTPQTSSHAIRTSLLTVAQRGVTR